MVLTHRGRRAGVSLDDGFDLEDSAVLLAGLGSDGASFLTGRRGRVLDEIHVRCGWRAFLFADVVASLFSP